jgi:hypothetical protein
VKQQFKRVVKGLPYIRRLVKARDRLEAENLRLRAELAQAPQLWVPPGHFHSPLPPLDDLRARQERIFDRTDPTIPGIDLNVAEQLRLLDEFAGYYPSFPWGERPKSGLRFFLDNPCFAHTDALWTAGLMRHYRPKRFIEVGCGYSSAVELDASELFLDNSVEFTFIDPYPAPRFYDGLKPGDAGRIRVIPRFLQDVELAEFTRLEANDFLFIDASHVTRTDSDVNYVLFHILPALPPGVVVHFHDILYPFEYFAEWVYEGRAWNEAYILRAFLQYNDAFRVILWNHYLHLFHADRFRETMPLCLRNHGGSIWLRKV